MNGNGVSRGPGHGLNGADELYYETVEGSQSPGGLLLSPAAFINPAQYSSVLEGRFKQLQGGLGRAARGPPRRAGPGTWERSRSREHGGGHICDSDVCAGRRCARGIITSGQKIRGC